MKLGTDETCLICTQVQDILQLSTIQWFSVLFQEQLMLCVCMYNVMKMVPKFLTLHTQNPDWSEVFKQLFQRENFVSIQKELRFFDTRKWTTLVQNCSEYFYIPLSGLWSVSHSKCFSFFCSDSNSWKWFQLCPTSAWWRSCRGNPTSTAPGTGAGPGQGISEYSAETFHILDFIEYILEILDEWRCLHNLLKHFGCESSPKSRNVRTFVSQLVS